MEMQDWSEAWDNENKSRLKIDYKKLCSFGIKPLDDALIGILPTDLIAIGADSGVGKSELCLNMALYNAERGKKIALYFIEGGAEEAIARIKWKAIRDKYYSEGHNTVDMDYRKWRMNMLQGTVLDKIEKDCMIDLLCKIEDRLQIYSFEEGFTVQHLINSLGYFRKQKVEYGMHVNDGHDVDLIIIDHLQYFTLTNEKSEYQEVTDILMKVKDITINHKIPVVLVSHLRKKDKERGLPGQEDFMGTSNISKISSICITITPDYAFDNYAEEIYPTFFRFAKSRTKISPSLAVRCNFKLLKGEYENSYEVYSLINDKPKENPLDILKLPKWAKSAWKPANQKHKEKYNGQMD